MITSVIGSAIQQPSIRFSAEIYRNACKQSHKRSCFFFSTKTLGYSLGPLHKGSSEESNNVHVYEDKDII